jgi:hypothetical protein
VTERKRYAPPTLVRRDRLAQVAEGDGVRITDGRVTVVRGT